MLMIHPDAQARFDALATDVRSGTVPGTLPDRDRTPNPPHDERELDRTLSAKDIVPGSLVVGLTDHRGHTSSLFFEIGGVCYAIEGEAMESFNRLTALLCRQRHIREAVGPEGVARRLLDWVKTSLGAGETRSFTSYLLTEVNAVLQVRTIVLPLENFRSESDFELGGVRFTHLAMTRQMFDDVEQRWIAHQPDQEAEIGSAVKRYRRWFQGQTCGFVTLEAESRWAARGAAEIVDRALSALRLFSPSAFAPGFKSAVGRVGRVHVPGDVTCEIVDGAPAHVTDAVAEGYSHLQWNWSDEDRNQALKVGLADFDRLLRADDPSELEGAVLDAIALLDESVTCNGLHKRAALALTAAEALLLRNDTEPLQLILGLRCGFLTRRTAEERMQVAETIRAAYAMRSGYVHHGSTASDSALLSDLHCVLLDAFAAVARATGSLKTREELFAALERNIWS